MSILFYSFTNRRKIEWEQDFARLETFIQEYGSGPRLLLIGDLNARTADHQWVPVEIDRFIEGDIRGTRLSKDRIINRKGRSVLELLDSSNLVILNGRVRGNQYGEYTFIGPTGSSVIDYGCVTLNCVDLVNDFEIGRELFSEHMPILLKLNLLPVRDVSNSLPKLKWSEKTKEKYQNRLRRSCTELNNLPRVVNDASKKLNDMIYSAIRDSGTNSGWRKGNTNECKHE